jgi:hypothetical protein
MTPVAQQYHANIIYSGAYGEKTWYSTSKEGVNSLNELLEMKGMKIEIKPIAELSEEEVIRRMIKQYPTQFYMTHPCVLDDMMFTIKRNWFKEKFKGFPLMEGSCGVCGKDIELNMARLMHDPLVAQIDYTLQRTVAEYYVKRSKQENSSDFIEPELVAKVQKKFNIIS